MYSLIMTKCYNKMELHFGRISWRSPCYTDMHKFPTEYNNSLRIFLQTIKWLNTLIKNSVQSKYRDEISYCQGKHQGQGLNTSMVIKWQLLLIHNKAVLIQNCIWIPNFHSQICSKDFPNDCKTLLIDL